MKVKTVIGKLILSLIGSGATFFLGDDSTRWLYAILTLIAIYSIASIIGYRKKIWWWIKKCYYSIVKKPMIQSVPGFFGRETVVKIIYEQYCASKGIRTILICGMGGSGKTTVYSFFSKVLANSPRVVSFTKSISAKSLHNRTILFADYAYENLTQINNLISSLAELKKKRILVVLLERTYAKGYLATLKYDFIIDLNESEYTLTEENLQSIITYNVAYKYDAEKDNFVNSNTTIDEQKAHELANQITKRIDPVYHRPVFAYIIAELYRANPQLDFSKTTSINLLLEQYWKKKTRYHMLQGLVTDSDAEFGADKMRIEAAVNNAKQLVELLTLFCSMTKLIIKHDNRNRVLLQSDDEMIIDQHLSEYIDTYISRMLDDDIKKHLVTKILDIDIGKTPEFQTESKFEIKPIRFDIVSTWLLEKYYSTSPEYTRELGSIIRSITNKQIDKAVLSFILRSINDDNNDILSWYGKIKDEFVNYEIQDFEDIICSSFEKIDVAVHNNNNSTVDSINNFLIDLIETIFDHTSNEAVNALSVRIQKILGDSMYLPTTRIIADDFVNILIDRVDKTQQKLEQY